MTAELKHKHVFLSYSTENRALIRKLRNELISEGESVWWDQDLLPGQDWDYEIEKAIRSAHNVICCVSSESEAREQSGMYPELRTAIGIYRTLKTGSIYLIPVRLSECRVPEIGIDHTRRLSDLHYIDLFPDEANWKAGVDRLIQAIRNAPLYP